MGRGDELEAKVTHKLRWRNLLVLCAVRLRSHAVLLADVLLLCGHVVLLVLCCHVVLLVLCCHVVLQCCTTTSTVLLLVVVVVLLCGQCLCCSAVLTAVLRHRLGLLLCGRVLRRTAAVGAVRALDGACVHHVRVALILTQHQQQQHVLNNQQP